MPIATIGAEVRVTPGDEIQILRAKGDYEFVDDRTPFTVRVEDVLREDGAVIGVVGPVISGPSRYTGMVATLLTRLDGQSRSVTFIRPPTSRSASPERVASLAFRTTIQRARR